MNVYTDLALEAHEMLTTTEELEGVKLTVDSTENEEIKVVSVEISTEEGAKKMGKPIGNYITVESQLMKANHPKTHEQITKILSNKLAMLHNLDEDSVILIVGLGNRNVTPDALGPKVISKVIVTRHLVSEKILPEEIVKDVRQVCAVSPGVLGTTGIETCEIVKGIVDKIKPDLVIAIDALAARATSRINATIQIADTGINPGSGLGNKRKAINEETLGVKVIAIGVPTVVDAATLVNDTLDKLIDTLLEEAGEGSAFYKMLKNLEAQDKYNLIVNILEPYVGNMFVTPKEVDDVVVRLSNIIANSLNIALQPNINNSNIKKYIH